MRRCSRCQSPISQARLAALPDTRVCVECSTEQPTKGYMTWEHKTAPVFQAVTPQQHQWLQSRDRKGMRSGLPMSSRNAASVLAGTSSAYIPSRNILAANPLSLVPNATKCPHTDRPQASSAGKCVECAVSYYQIRAAHASGMPTKK